MHKRQCCREWLILKSEQLRNEILRLFKTPSARDKQHKIGPSLYASPCTYCVGSYLHGVRQPESKFWMGARIGTAIHDLLETYAGLDGFKQRFPDALVEHRVQLGTLENYGRLSGSADLVLPSERMVVDYKTTDRVKVKALKRAYESEPNDYDTSAVLEARYKLQTYAGQMSQYARGLGLYHGVEIDTLGIVFINRDGKTDDDMWAMTTDFDASYADHVWYRLQAVWEHVQEYGVDGLESHPLCWPCNNNF